MNTKSVAVEIMFFVSCKKKCENQGEKKGIIKTFNQSKADFITYFSRPIFYKLSSFLLIIFF